MTAKARIELIFIFIIASRDKTDSIDVNTGIFLGKICSNTAKTIIVDTKNWEKCCKFKRYVLRLDSMLRELSELHAGYASY